MDYVIFYTIVTLLLPLSLYFTQKRKIHFISYHWSFSVFFSLTLIILIRAFAYDTGADYMVYYNNYLYNGNTVWGENREIGYKLLNSFLYNISHLPQLFFGFATFIYMYAILMVSQLFGKADKWIVYFWFVILFVLSYNLYRQYFSLSFILLAYYWFVKNNFIKVFIYCALAISFHTSAIIGLTIIIGTYLLRNKDISIKYLLLAIILTTVASSTILSTFLESLSFVSNWYYQETGKLYSSSEFLESRYETSILLYPSMISYLILVWYGNNLVKEFPKLRFTFYLFTLALIIEPLTNQEILMRIRLYIAIFIPLILGSLAYRYKKIWRYPILWGALFYLIIKFTYTLYYLGSVYPLHFKL